VVFISCKKDKNTKGVLNITAINDSKSEIVNVKLKSNQKSMEFMDEKTFPIGCHYMFSTTFDAKNKTFGYMGCDDAYHIFEVGTGVEIKQIPLQESIGLVVVDTIRNVLIGKYFIGGTGKDDGTDHVLTINLNDGSIISDKPFYVGGYWNGTCFFRDIENEYVLLTANNVLVFVNPYTGDIIRTLNVDTEIYSGVYDKINNRLICMTFSNGMSKDDVTGYIVTIDLNTGKTLSKVIAQGLNCGIWGEEKDYDAETNSYIVVSGKNEVLFFDVATGNVNERYQLDFDVTSLKVWRNNK
jgi:hypothetical protein